MRRVVVATLAAVVALTLLSCAAQERTLQIWFIDVEGGQATLIVTPAGESMLIDAGYSPKNWRGAVPKVPDGRDPARILAAIGDAGLTRLDYLLVTHFHPDHVGGVPEVAARIPVTTFIDYGAPATDDPSAQGWFRNYEPTRARGRHLVVRPGDRIPMKGLDVDVLSADGELIAKPLPGAGAPNATCATAEDQPDDGTENLNSISVLLRFGAFRFLDLGDLSGNTLTRLACPRDLVGPVSVYLIAHHGDYDTSVPALYSALRPRVAIMNNGALRGGDPEAFRVARSGPGLEDLWQLHWAEGLGAQNSAGAHVANIDDGMTGYALRLSAAEDGAFRIVNGRTGVGKSYPAPPRDER